MSTFSIPVGKFLVTPLHTQPTASGQYAATVSIRRGQHDRVVRFTPLFQTMERAARYALDQARSMVLQNRLP